MAISRREKQFNEIRSAVADRLKKIRTHFGYSRGEMAAKLGISKITYAKNERAMHLPTTFHFIALYNRLGISIDWLLFNHEPMSWKEHEKQQAELEMKQQAELEMKQKEEEEKRKQAELQPPKDVFTLEVEEMIDTMKKVPLLRHMVMGYYQKFKMKNKEMIEEHLQKASVEE
jgi:transcriptional regulator with XRE-family HTH domain